LARYIRKYKRIGSIGPSEERNFGLWVGYDLVGLDADLTAQGFTRVDDWPAERLASHGVETFLRVEPDDEATYAKLGIGRT
jgi:hypothetical protein